MAKGTGILKEYHLDVNDFNEPRASVGKTAVAVLVVRLLLLEPGTDPMRPEMGVGLVSKYRYMFPTRLPELKQNICDQLERFLFPYQTVGIELDIDDKELYIEVTVDDHTYKFVTKEQENNRITLTELFESA